MKDRAKALAHHLKKERSNPKLPKNLVPVPDVAWESLPFSQLLKKELDGYIDESTVNIETLNRIQVMLQDVMSSRLSPIKQSLILSRLGQISEAQLARLSQLEWQQLNLNNIHQALNQFGIKSLQHGYKKLFDIKQKNYHLLQEIQKHPAPAKIECDIDWDLQDETNIQPTPEQMLVQLNELISLGKRLCLQKTKRPQEVD